MLINDKRALAYTAYCGEITPIAGADNIELMKVNGWSVIIKKGEFKTGDLCVYFEIDSKLPAKEWSAFLEPKGYKVKTMKLSRFGVISQGLALPTSIDKTASIINIDNVDCTELLGVTYSVAEDNSRKATNAGMQSMQSRHKKLLKKKPFKWLMKREWGRNMLFFFLGAKHEKKTAFPSAAKFPGLQKSDQERIENMWNIAKEHCKEYIETVKIDGTSATYILERKAFGYEFWVLSRNVRQLSPDSKNYHSTEENVYWLAAKKFKIEEFLKDFLHKNPQFKWAAIQGEIAGVTDKGTAIQGNPHKFKDLRFFGYDMYVPETGKIPTVTAMAYANNAGIEWVPITNYTYTLPDILEEFKLHADGQCEADGASGLREGYVYRDPSDGHFSFKNVSNKYLLKKGE